MRGTQVACVCVSVCVKCSGLQILCVRDGVSCAELEECSNLSTC